VSDTWPLVVVGGGPAGIAAATEAARAGLRCLLVDEAPSLGGQIYRQLPEPFRAKDPRRLGRDHARGARLRDALPDSVEVRSRTSVIDIVDGRRIVCATPDGPTEWVPAERLVIATGAYDRAVPFPGWTLPGVLTAGGAQALLKTMRVRPGDRALVCGTGPLLLVVAGQLHHAGVEVVGVLEAGRSAYTAGTLARSWRSFGLLRDGARYRLDLIRAGIPVRYHHSVVAAYGDDAVAGVGYAPVDPDTWTPDRTRERRVEVDLLVVGYGFVPNVELCELAGCRTVYVTELGGWVPFRDATMQTSVPGVFAAGDGAGVAGALAAVDDRLRRAPLRRLRSLARVRAVLDEISYPRPGLADLATGPTPVCRCEEVTRAHVQAAVAEGARDLQAVKLLTRLGMGACQGRTCAPPAALLCGSPAAAGRINPRPPVKPVTLAALARTRGGEPCTSSSSVAE
jgi:NADPH-dependent 2,4-dienoyl-CoA reductase/sulfur reductase-like enzyme